MSVPSAVVPILVAVSSSGLTLESEAYVVVGMAGHIDHGKTALVHALTGMKTERHREEEIRGMTIDLGFACLQHAGMQLAIIDVPGHERFVANMLAGVGGIDLALLCIDCCEGVRPQTREHLDILHLLGVQQGIVVLTKCDLADEELQLLAEEQAAELTAPTSLSRAPLVKVSARTGAGISELMDTLVQVGRECVRREQRDPSGPFRLPIDRAFHREGHGTVITGTIWSGRVRIGDLLHLSPTDSTVRVRRIEVHGRNVEQVSAGHRAALNVSGSMAGQIIRGHELVSPDSYREGTLFSAEVHLLPSAKHPLLHGCEIRLHTATRQISARLLLDRPQLEPGDRACVVCKCDAPLVFAFGQPFLIRKPLPAGTVGGGRFLTIEEEPGGKTKQLILRVHSLMTENHSHRLVAWIDSQGLVALDSVRMQIDVGLSSRDVRPLLNDLLASGQIRRFDDWLVTADYCERMRQKILRILNQSRPQGQVAWVPRSKVVQEVSRESGQAAESVAASLVRELLAEGSIVERHGALLLSHSAVQLSPKQQSLLEGYLAACRDNRTPPTLEEHASQMAVRPDVLMPLADLAAQAGWLIEVSRELYVSPSVLDALREEFRQLARRESSVTVAQIRDHWRMTRKHAIPYLEYLDATGFTVREGSLRRLSDQQHSLPQ